ncbi:concanavalin A-like lectin/glucanase [Trichodelitschia bisporula]|uniref:Concanavalin A-like lectin/glucanase n=1 Tax=Trichodelitschia bisporula TaxID=703511 RepID=A0A6G1HMM0_9PEZI|nr:concanavalin A-like lectin/glucanase [Trichodelitschia bisporula]
MMLRLALFVAVVFGAALHDNSLGCDCYETGASFPARYAYHRFFDFRAVPDAVPVEPANVFAAQDKGLENGQLGSAYDQAFLTDWTISTTSTGPLAQAPVRRQDSKVNTYIQGNGGGGSRLVLRAYKVGQFASSAQIDSKENDVLFASIRVNARVSGGTGAAASIYAAAGDSDLDILTRDPPTQIRYTGQASASDNGSAQPIAMPNGVSWGDFNEYRLDWRSDVSAWSVNGALVGSKQFGVPSSPGGLTLSMWNNGGPISGNMSTETSAHFEIQWIQMVFNTSTPVMTPCKRVCAVDGVQKVGYPELEHKGAGSQIIVQTWHTVLVLAMSISLLCF